MSAASTPTAPRSASPPSAATCPPTPAAALDDTIDELNASPDCTGYIVQLPLPRHLDENAAPGARRPGQGRRRAAPDEPGPARVPTRPAAVLAPRHRALLRRYDVSIAGAHVVVIGRGVTVGRPLGLLLTRAHRERHGHVVPHRNSRPAVARPAQADIIVAAVGVPPLLTADMVRPGAAVARRRREPGRGQAHRRRAPRRVGGGRAGLAQPRRVGPLPGRSCSPTWWNGPKGHWDRTGRALAADSATASPSSARGAGAVADPDRCRDLPGGADPGRRRLLAPRSRC